MRKLLLGIPAIALLSSTLLPAAQAETQDYVYEYTGGANLSGMTAGTLRIGEFTDARASAASDSITIGSETRSVKGGLAGLLQSAMANALEAARAPMSPDAGIALNADVLEFSTQQTAEGLQLTLRCNVAVNQQGRTLWESVLFSRATAESGEFDEAMNGLLDRLTRELFRDDYFRMSLGIF